MNGLVRDLGIAVRGLRRTPGQAGAIVLILGLAIGMAAAIGAVAKAVLVQNLPIAEQDRVLALWPFGDGETVEMPVFQSDIDRLRAESKTLTGVAAFTHWGTNATPWGEGERSLILNRTIVTGNYFDVLGARPVLGRLLRPDDDVKGAVPVVVLSYGTWRRHFGANPNAIGRELVDAYTRVRRPIVGVAPPGLDFPLGTEVWTTDPYWGWPANVLARLAPNATAVAAETEFFALVRPFNPDWKLRGAKATPLAELVLGDVRPILVALTVAGGLLLLIACVNIANLLLLRSGKRAGELAIRRALGASGAMIARQLGIESFLLAIPGGLLGVLAATALLRAFSAFGPVRLPRFDAVDAGPPIAVGIGVTIVALICFGLGPALMAVRGQPTHHLRLDHRGGSESKAGRRLRESLASAQVALTLVMLTAAGLVVTTLFRLQNLDLGYDRDRLSVLSIAGPIAKFDTPAKLRRVGEIMVGPLRAIPGVVGLTPVLETPYNGVNVWRWKFDAEGQSAAEVDRNPQVPIEVGGSEYFQTFGITIERGRGFLETDRPGNELVVVVSRSVAERFWPSQDPIGRRLRVIGLDSSVPGQSDWRTVVGVTADVHLRSVRESNPTVYLPWQQSFWQGFFAIRTAGPLDAIVPSIRRTIRDVDPEILLWQADPIEALLAEPMARPRLSAFLMSAFGVMALVLAAIGLYAVIATLVREQTRDIGIRMALGASPTRVGRGVLGRTLLIFGLGALVGVVAALSTSHLLHSVLFEVSPTEPLALVGAVALLLGVALLAALGPVRRATTIDPVEALRTE